MSRLVRLRNELTRLRNVRRMLRQARGAGLLLNAAVVILLLAFLADWRLDMTRAQRAVLLGLVIAALVQAFRRLMRPWLAQREDLIDLALLVERRQRIDSDLVSALQFEEPAAREWGSEQLEQAVVAQAARRCETIDVFDGLRPRDLPRRLALVATVAGAVLLACLIFREHSTAFFQRLLLADVQYPTRTRIERVEVNGQSVLEFPVARTDSPTANRPAIFCPVSHPVTFSVWAGGELPASGSGIVRIESLNGTVGTEVRLTQESASSARTGPADRATGPPATSSGPPRSERPRDEPASRGVRFTGELPRLMESVSFRVLLGDARTPAVTIEAIPLPVIDLHLDVTPPGYAEPVETAARDDSTRAQRQPAVLEGSRIGVRVECLNKPLAQVRLWLDDEEFPLVAADLARRRWTFPPAGSPLESVTRSLRYRLDVVDDQGLSLENPVHGTIRLKSDQPPRIVAAVRTRRVLPTARPPVVWSASDDYGLARVAALVQIARADGGVEETELDIAARPDGAPALLRLGGTWPLDLSRLKLVKGDQLKVTLVATDFRGDAEPRRSFSEPVPFEVTDRQGILAGLLETDEESAKQLDAIIRRELGIGEAK